MARYDLAVDPYIDPETGILHNKIGARTEAELAQAEADISYVVIRTFLRLLAVKIGYDIDWGVLDAEENIQASVQSIRGNNLPMEAILDKLVVTLDVSKFNPDNI